MYCEYCGRKLEDNEICSCCNDDYNETSLDFEVNENGKMIYCEYCGRELDSTGKCSCQSTDITSNMLSDKGFAKLDNPKKIGIIIGVVLLVAILIFGLSKLFDSDKNLNNENEIDTTYIEENEELPSSSESMMALIDRAVEEVNNSAASNMEDYQYDFSQLYYYEYDPNVEESYIEGDIYSFSYDKGLCITLFDDNLYSFAIFEIELSDFIDINDFEYTEQYQIYTSMYEDDMTYFFINDSYRSELIDYSYISKDRRDASANIDISEWGASIIDEPISVYDTFVEHAIEAFNSYYSNEHIISATVCDVYYLEDFSDEYNKYSSICVFIECVLEGWQDVGFVAVEYHDLIVGGESGELSLPYSEYGVVTDNSELTIREGLSNYYIEGLNNIEEYKHYEFNSFELPYTDLGFFIYEF